MRILVMLHPAFLPSEAPQRAEALSWVRAFAEGIGAELFRSESHRLRDFDVVHVFSGRDPETWHEIRKSGRKLVVTPQWWAGPAPVAAGSPLKRALRALKQRRWPPVDEDWFFACPDLFLAFSGFSRAGIAPRELPRDAREAARVARGEYDRLGARR